MKRGNSLPKIPRRISIHVQSYGLMLLAAFPAEYFASIKEIALNGNVIPQLYPDPRAFLSLRDDSRQRSILFWRQSTGANHVGNSLPRSREVLIDKTKEGEVESEILEVEERKLSTLKVRDSTKPWGLRLRYLPRYEDFSGRCCKNVWRIPPR